MATTTTNFGFDVPTSSDLVKNGATAISTLGQDIDTFLAGSPTRTAGKNKIINGDFGIWQRGTSLATYGYLADRFYGDTNATVTQSRQTFTPGTAPVAGYEGSFFYRLAKSSGGSYVSLQQKIEDVRTFAGQTITLSFWAKIDSGTQSVGTAFEQNFGSGGSSGVYTYGSNVTLTTTWTRYSVTVTLPSIAGKTIGTSSFLNVLSLNLSSSAAITFDYWGVQLEAGSVATAFQTATGTIQGELAACQRYYYRSTSSAGSQTSTGISGITNSTTNLVGYFNPPVPMRVTPTAVEFSSIGTQTTGSGLTAISAVAIVNESNNNSVSLNLTSSGFTANLFGLVRGTTGTGYIGLSAEL